MHGTVGVIGMNRQQNLFGIPNIGGIFKRAIPFIPGVGPIVSPVVNKLFPGGGGPQIGQPPPPRSFAGPSRCIPPFFDDGAGGCVLDIIPGPGGPSRPGQRPEGFGGAATVGQFGVGMEPGVVSRSTRVCLKGMQLGSDGLCYNKGVLKNNQREWPKGRRPLLTGGEMRCISTAARASKRLQGTTKRLQKMGMLPKPATKSRAKPKTVAAVPAGTSIVNVE